MHISEIEPKQLKDLLDNGAAVTLIDVRQSEEHELVKIEGSILIPLMELEGRIEELKKLCSSDSVVVVYCRSGKRSETAINYLRSVGFSSDLKNLRGGINAYAKEADSSLSPY